jgi:4-diphosphocytidyl-2-C-methyl-D-erythritol kinase
MHDPLIALSPVTPRVTRWRAPAKVNLTLHILGRRDDGWHALDSLVAFAGCGDTLLFSPGNDLALSVDGPTGVAAGPAADNLVMRAAQHLQRLAPGLRVGRFHLRKTLPVAAGLGGGSSDAAAALRALANENGFLLDDPRMREAARLTGADVLVCLDPRARRMSGLGDIVGPAVKWPPLFAVLANSGAEVPTPAVFARLGLRNGERTSSEPFESAEEIVARADAVAALLRGRNDMESAALVLAPSIGQTLEALAHAGGLLTRMSGSGATCFALFRDRQSTVRAARAIASAHPAWWVRATLLR